MTEEELKKINAPTEKEINENHQKRNTYIFVAVQSIFNLVITIVLAFTFLFLSTFIVRSCTPDMSQESFNNVVKPILWVAVLLAIFVSFVLQKWLTKVIIKSFKLYDKLQPDFVARYVMEKK